MRIERLSDWKHHTFQKKNFLVDKAVLDEVLIQRTDDNGELYLYLKEVYEDERTIEKILSDLAARKDIQIDISQATFKDSLKNFDSPLEKNCPKDYNKILDNPANICMKIFTKSLCVISGKAGTGKTTVIRAILNNVGTGTSFRLLAPTGKAAERIRVLTGKPSLRFIRSWRKTVGLTIT